MPCIFMDNSWDRLGMWGTAQPKKGEVFMPSKCVKAGAASPIPCLCIWGFWGSHLRLNCEVGLKDTLANAHPGTVQTVAWWTSRGAMQRSRGADCGVVMVPLAWLGRQQNSSQPHHVRVYTDVYNDLNYFDMISTYVNILCRPLLPGGWSQDGGNLSFTDCFAKETAGGAPWTWSR